MSMIYGEQMAAQDLADVIAYLQTIKQLQPDSQKQKAPQCCGAFFFTALHSGCYSQPRTFIASATCATATRYARNYASYLTQEAQPGFRPLPRSRPVSPRPRTVKILSEAQCMSNPRTWSPHIMKPKEAKRASSKPTATPLTSKPLSDSVEPRRLSECRCLWSPPRWRVGWHTLSIRRVW